MSPGTAKRLSRGIVGVALVMIVVTLVVRTASFKHQEPGRIFIVGDATVGDGTQVHQELIAGQRDGQTFEVAAVNPIGVIFVVVSLLWMITGSLIVSRQPRNSAGWIFLTIGVALPIGGLAGTLATTGVKTHPGSVPLVGLWAVVDEYSFLPIALLPLLFLLFPDGRPPTPGWRWAKRALFAGLAIALMGFVLSPGPLNNLVDAGILYQNPIGIPALAGVSGAMTAIGVVICFLAGISTVFAVRGRFKRSVGEERQQLRWLVFVATAAGVLFVITFSFGLLPGGDGAAGGFPFFSVGMVLLAAVIAFGVPGAYQIAIYRYGLWDLDVVIKKAAVALILTLLMAGVGIAALAIFGQFAIYEGTNPRISVVAGIAFGLLFLPLLRLARKIAARLTFGSRATPYEVLTAFGQRVGETYSTDDVLPRMAHMLASGTGATSARVLLRVGPDLREEARWPNDASPPGDEHVVAVVDQGEELGALAVTMPASDPMNPAKEKLVADLAAQAGLVLRNVRLIEELRASRQRLVSAQDEERRKIERNIHDGAQQQLVALAVKLRLADTLIERDRSKAHELMTQLQGETSDALEDLRDLAHGIYPPLLADRGLVAALEAQARKAAIPTTVQANDVERYARETEASVYFCVLEALNNVAKYAGATAVMITLAQANGDLRFTVADDGVGFDPTTTGYGTGLQGMADRLDAVGGTLEVRSAPGEGTRIMGSLRATAEAP